MYKKKTKKSRINHAREKFIYRSTDREKKKEEEEDEDTMMARPRRNFKALDSLYARRKVHNDRAIKIFPRHRC